MDVKGSRRVLVEPISGCTLRECRTSRVIIDLLVIARILHEDNYGDEHQKTNAGESSDLCRKPVEGTNNFVVYKALDMA